jgi:dolichol-phosphate mannosyltransferase
VDQGILHSAVVPVFNEVAGIDRFQERCATAMSSLGDGYEIVYVDDGSSDGSWAKLTAIARADRRVRLVRLSRNFGHQIAISAGIQHAVGDTVTVMDADLQDPPEVVPELVARWREGADVVYAIRTRREGETWFKRLTAAAFYRLLGLLSDIDIPPDVGDFRLLSRRAVDALLAMPEHHRYIRGMVAWLGFETASVDYVREPRVAGETKYPFSKLVRLAADGVMAFSIRPLRLATWLGLVVSLLAALAAAALVIGRLAGMSVIQGWTSLAVLVLLLSGVQLVTIGTLGEYVGRIYAEVRGRPLYLVRETVGLGVSRMGPTHAEAAEPREDRPADAVTATQRGT